MLDRWLAPHDRSAGWRKSLVAPALMGHTIARHCAFVQSTTPFKYSQILRSRLTSRGEINGTGTKRTIPLRSVAHQSWRARAFPPPRPICREGASQPVQQRCACLCTVTHTAGRYTVQLSLTARLVLPCPIPGILNFLEIANTKVAIPAWSCSINSSSDHSGSGAQVQTAVDRQFPPVVYGLSVSDSSSTAAGPSSSVLPSRPQRDLAFQESRPFASGIPTVSRSEMARYEHIDPKYRRSHLQRQVFLKMASPIWKCDTPPHGKPGYTALSSRQSEYSHFGARSCACRLRGSPTDTPRGWC